jgi:hypothetical protein
VPRPDRSVGRRALPASQAGSRWLLALAATVLAVPVVHLVVPPALALPAISLLLLLAGFAIAAFAYWTGRTADAERLGPKDVAGALVLLGFAAALLSDAESALATIEQWQIGLIAAGPM